MKAPVFGAFIDKILIVSDTIVSFGNKNIYTLNIIVSAKSCLLVDIGPSPRLATTSDHVPPAFNGFHLQ